MRNATAEGLTVVDAQELIRVQVDNLREAIRGQSGYENPELARDLADAADFAVLRLRELEKRAVGGEPGAETLFGQAGALAVILTHAEALMIAHAGNAEDSEDDALEMWNAFHVLVDTMDMLQHTGETITSRPGVVI